MLTEVLPFKTLFKFSVKEDILKSLKDFKVIVFINYIKGKYDNSTVLLTTDCHEDKIRVEQIPHQKFF